MSPFQQFLLEVRGLFRIKSPVEKCMVSLGVHRDDVADRVDAAVAGLNTSTSYNWSLILSDAAHQAGIRKFQLDTVVAEGPPGVFMIAVDWCYIQSGYDYMVVEPGVGTHFYQSNPGAMTIDSVSWQDGAWAVISDIGSGLHIAALTVVSEDGTLLSNSFSNPGAQGQLIWGGTTMPEFEFLDGFRQFTVRWEGSSGRPTITTYRWDGEKYYLESEEIIEE